MKKNVIFFSAILCASALAVSCETVKVLDFFGGKNEVAEEIPEAVEVAAEEIQEEAIAEIFPQDEAVDSKDLLDESEENLYKLSKRNLELTSSQPAAMALSRIELVPYEELAPVPEFISEYSAAIVEIPVALTEEKLPFTSIPVIDENNTVEEKEIILVKKAKESSPAEDTSADDSKSTKTTTQAPAKSTKKTATPSRTVSLSRNQPLEVVYPGNGWIYLGEVEDKGLIRYAGRHIGEENTVFDLRTRGSGTTVLHFYKNDALTASFIDDWLEVVIDESVSDGTKITAPEYAAVIPATPSIYANQNEPSKEEKFVEIEPEKTTLNKLLGKEDATEATASTGTSSASGNDLSSLASIQDAFAQMNDDSADDKSSEATPATAETSASTDTKTAAEIKADTKADTKKSDKKNDSKKAENKSTADTSSATPAAPETESSTSEATAAEPAQNDTTIATVEESQETTPVDDTNFSTAIQMTDEEREIQELLASQATSESLPIEGSLDAIMGATTIIRENEYIDMNADDLLKKAQQAYNQKHYDKALAYLRDFFNTSTTRLDEGLFLQGQVYEANSSLRDIKAALDSYETLVKNYPSSSKWQNANERIIYINRFYYNKR